MALLQSLKAFVNERLSAAAEEIFVVVERIIITDYDRAFSSKQQIDQQQRIPGDHLRAWAPVHFSSGEGVLSNPLSQEFQRLPLCTEEIYPEQQVSSPSLIQEEPEPPLIEEEQQELLQRPEEAAVSTQTFIPAVTHVEDDYENRETEPLASTSAEHMETQADVEDCGTSQPTSDGQLLSSHCSESDSDEWEEETRENQSAIKTIKYKKTQNKEDSDEQSESSQYDTEDSDECKENRKDQPALDTLWKSLKSHKTQNVEGQRMSLRKKKKMSLRKKKEPKHEDEETSQPDTEDSDECVETREDQSALNTTQNVEGQRLSLSIKKDSKSSKQTPPARSHTGEYICTLCGKVFGLWFDLKIHMRTHAAEKPLTCTVCSKSFCHMGDLRKHAMSHIVENPFACTFCSKGFGCKSALNTHMKSHKGENTFTCAVCSKGFSQMCNLKAHMRIHTGEKPFTCSFCAKGFAQKGNLKAHVRVHTGEKT